MADGTDVGRLADLKRFYALLEELGWVTGGPRPLASLSQFRDWPPRGVYFFLDPNEARVESGGGPRVVRVGTHALTSGSKSTLRQRLSQHRGNASGGGNHRGSIFRLLVGQSLIAKGVEPPCPSWGVKGDKSKACEALRIHRTAMDLMEAPIEWAVSQYLTTLHFLWLDVDDSPSQDSLRGYIEQHAIALLSNHGRPAMDASSQHWLGHHSNRPLVRQSGLWNQRHVEELHEPEFLAAFKEQINRSEAGND